MSHFGYKRSWNESQRRLMKVLLLPFNELLFESGLGPHQLIFFVLH
jgi:hypothetical protein